MQENIGPTDLAIRIVLTACLAGVAFVFAADLRVSAPSALAAVWLTGTVLTRRCPLYHVFRHSSCIPPQNARGPRHSKL